MNKFFPATILATALVATPAMAEVELGLGASLEHSIEASSNTFSLSPKVSGLPLDTELKITLDYEDPQADGGFEYNGLSVDFSVPVTESVELYVKNDFTDTNDHSETTIGVAVNFF